MINKKEETKNFSDLIERLRRQKKLSYMDAIVLYCEENNFEIESAAKILSPTIKNQLRIEAEKLHFIPAKKDKLPTS